MKHKLLLLLVMTICILTSCNSTQVEGGGPRYTGEILKIDTSNKKILIKGNKDFRDFWLTITNKTEISTKSEEELSFDDLKVGDIVDTWFTGDFSVKTSKTKFTQKGELILAFLQVRNE
jgi:hypothetical protein